MASPLGRNINGRNQRRPERSSVKGQAAVQKTVKKRVQKTGRIPVRALRFHTENPTNYEIIQEYDFLTDQEIEKRLVQNQLAQRRWHTTPVTERVDCFSRLAEALRARRENFALQMALEMGKPVKEGRSEVDKCAATCDYFSHELPRLLRSAEIQVNEKTQRVIKEPLGPILAVMPWNFPLWQVIRSLVPILGSGNSYLLKHSTDVAGCAQMMAQVFTDIFGEGLVTNLFITHEQAERLTADRRVRGVTMTGSSRGGREVAAAAGKNLKKVLLELGGSDAYIVLDDADLQKAAELCTRARLVNNGQSCVAAKRFLVPQSKKTQFMEAMEAEMDIRVMGLPQEDSTDLGPLAHRRFREAITKQLEQIQKEGAKKFWQQSSKGLRGAFFPPTILSCSGSEPSLVTEEFFAPVASVIDYESDDDAIAKANNCIYGLGGAVIGPDSQRAEQIASRLECGFVAINGSVASDARLPFGGVKDSGFGRELGPWGVDEFVSLKTITVS